MFDSLGYVDSEGVRGANVTQDLVTGLLPLLGRSLKAGFNVFDVMRHGSHEKQLSNVFAWLLDADGTHGMGDVFQRIFLAQLPVDRCSGQRYLVLQEVNTSATGEVLDIADVVLENDKCRIVVENFYTSDGHGHSYCGYLRFAGRGGRTPVVVLLCRDQDSSRQSDGWEKATVVTYGTLIETLRRRLEADSNYQRHHREAYLFIQHMYRKFVKDRGPMEDRELLDFVTAMCATGAADYYRWQSNDSARDKFAEEVATQAAERFGEGREILQRLKGRLRSYCTNTLRPQLNETMGDGFITGVSAKYAGSYQWTINFDVQDEGEDIGEARLQVKFGPSAWFANEKDPHWRRTVDRSIVDYSHVFLTRARYREIRQSAVTLQEVLDGLTPTDRRLHDEIVQMWRTPAASIPDPAGLS